MSRLNVYQNQVKNRRSTAAVPRGGRPGRKGRLLPGPFSGRWLVAAFGGAALGLILIGFWVIEGGWIGRILGDGERWGMNLLIDSGLTLKDIAVEGRILTPPDDIRRAVGMAKGSFILQVPTDTIRQNLEKLSWVRVAEVRRQLPGTIHIRLLERVPIALWQKNGHLHLIDDRGEIIGDVDGSTHSALPILTGDGAPERARDLFLALDQFPQVKRHVTGAILMGHRRWDLMVHHKLRVKLSETDMASSLKAFADLDADGALMKKDILAVDVRFKDRAYFYLAPTSAGARRQKPGQKG